jgi:membrane dipeptidase
MPTTTVRLAKQIERVPHVLVPLDGEQERRLKRLQEKLVLIDLHQHPFVFPEDVADLDRYFREKDYVWAFEAAIHGGWTAVTTANGITGLGSRADVTGIEFGDLTDEIGLMLRDVAKDRRVALALDADGVTSAKQSGRLAIVPSVEHLAIGNQLHRVDVLYGLGIRIAGLLHARKNSIGDGQMERTDAGLSELGVDVVDRMNDLGMLIDLSHVGARTAHETIEHSRAPVIFSHNAAHAVFAWRRNRPDNDFVACAAKGGLACVMAVPNIISHDAKQTVGHVLDHVDYLIKLVGADHVAIGTDILVGDHVALHRKLFAVGKANLPAPYLEGLESPAEGMNIVRGLITRGHSDATILKVAGANAMRVLRSVLS